MLYLGDHSSSSWWLVEASHQHAVAGDRTAVMIQSTVPRLNYQTLQQYIPVSLSPGASNTEFIALVDLRDFFVSLKFRFSLFFFIKIQICMRGQFEPELINDTFIVIVYD